MIPAAIVYVFAVMMTSICHEYYQFILAQGVLGGVGVGFLFAPTTASISQHFREKRAMALGISTAGSSIGGVLFPIALRNAFYGRLGFGWGVRVIGFVILVLLTIACALIKERLSHRKGQMFQPRAFRQPSYTWLVGGVFLTMWGFFTPYFYLSQYALEEVHLSVSLAFYLLSILNGASFLGRILPGIVADKLGRLNMLIAINLITGAIAFCLPHIHSHAGLFVWTAFFGFFSGAIISLSPAAFAEFTPSPQLIGTYSGQAMAVISIAALTGSPVAGAILDNHGWGSLSMFMGIVMIAGGACAAVGRLAHQPKLLAKV
jgi:predicted MFS family arabinose efflux permease